MNYLQAIILGIVQGITEFLPISSSGHLVIVPYLLNWNIPVEQIFPFNVLIQLGTIVSVIIYFWKDLINIIKDFVSGLFEPRPFYNEKTRMGWMIVIASIPAVLAGLLIKDLVESAFQSILAVAIFLIVTAILLFMAEKFGKRTKDMKETTWKNAIVIGLFQVLSLFPGISRSGSTISGGVLQGLKRKEAARFSFLMSIPVMIGAGILSLKDLLDVPNLQEFLPILLIGFFVSGIVGYLSIHWLLKFLNERRLTVFSIYCLILSLVIFVVYLIK
ncbi:MAG: undecaprenyl-diphosphatase UppP [Anaerolineaceae bacterium]|nr:MAG: undecaprenyl-diphosphatase UppP [Chloroflexi bacterium HGW-Chloroflexi-8]